MPHHSGRRLVLVAGAAILVLWGALYLVFLEWRCYRTRTSFGVTQAAPVIDALAEIIPPGVGAGALEGGGPRDSCHVGVRDECQPAGCPADATAPRRAEADRRAGRLHPETARDELASVWTAMADRAEFVLQEGTSGRRRAIPDPRSCLPGRSKKKVPSRNFLPPPTRIGPSRHWVLRLAEGQGTNPSRRRPADLWLRRRPRPRRRAERRMVPRLHDQDAS